MPANSERRGVGLSLRLLLEAGHNAWPRGPERCPVGGELRLGRGGSGEAANRGRSSTPGDRKITSGCRTKPFFRRCRVEVDFSTKNSTGLLGPGLSIHLDGLRQPLSATGRTQVDGQRRGLLRQRLMRITGIAFAATIRVAHRNEPTVFVSLKVAHAACRFFHLPQVHVAVAQPCYQPHRVRHAYQVNFERKNI